MAKFLVYIIIMAHWGACFWGMLAELEGQGVHTWLEQAKRDKAGECADAYMLGLAPERGATCAELGGPLNQYAISLYFSVYTITAVGFGDIAAQNRVEYFFAALFIAVGAIFWAFTIGNFCS